MAIVNCTHSIVSTESKSKLYTIGKIVNLDIDNPRVEIAVVEIAVAYEYNHTEADSVCTSLTS